MLKKPVTSLINRALRKAHIEQRFLRGQGYYYVTGVSVSSMYTVFRLGQELSDLRGAVDHVNEVLAQEGVHAHLVVKRQGEWHVVKVERHPVAYTGYLRRCYDLRNKPSSLNDWRESL